MAKSSKSLLSSSFKSIKASQKKWRKMTGFPVNKKKNFYDKYFEVPKSTYKPKKPKTLNTKYLEKLIESKPKKEKNKSFWSIFEI